MKKILPLILIIISNLIFISCEKTPDQPTYDVEKVNSVIEMINNIPSVTDIQLGDEEYIINVRNSYNDLTELEKTKVTNVNFLISAESKISRLKEKMEKDLIEEVEKLIETLPSIVLISLNDQYLIEEIQNKLNELSDNAKNKISNLMTFELAKTRYEDLAYEKLLNDTSSVVIDLINKLPLVENITLENEEEVLNARMKYDELLPGAQTLVNNIKKLIEIEYVISTLKDFVNFDPRDVLNCIEDVVTSNTNDLVITSGENFTVEWKSSNPNLFYFEDGYAKVSKVYQTHRKQNVTVFADITLSNGELITLTKLITVNPVEYAPMSDTPVATYFQSSALSSYAGYCDRYKEEGTLFSDKAKDVLDIIYYAFANIDSQGNISLSDYDIVDELTAMKAYDVRVVLCIAGVSSSGSINFATLTSDDTKRAKFVNNIMDTVEKYNFDGVDIDWESTSNAPVIAVNMNKLMKDLRNEMTARQDPAGTPYLLSAAVPASSWGAGSDRFDFKTLNNYVDYINMMSYDMNKTNAATHLSPLYKSSNDGGYGFGCDYGVDLFTSRGLDKSKIIIGSAGYGKSYKVTGNGGNPKYPALGASASLTHLSSVPGAHASGTLFINAVARLIKSGSYKKYIEYNHSGQLVGSYLYNESARIFITYDSEEVIAAKYEYAQANPGMGIMCWAYTEDTEDNFVNSIYDVKHK